jgi:hypothetical protein
MSLHRKYILELWRTDKALLLYLFGFPLLKILSYIIFVVAVLMRCNKLLILIAQVISVLANICGVMAIVMFIRDSMPSKNNRP